MDLFGAKKIPKEYRDIDVSPASLVSQARHSLKPIARRKEG